MKARLAEVVDVLNKKWPGPDWYMEDCAEGWNEGPGGYFTIIGGKYVAVDPNKVINLSTVDFYFEWQGEGPRPSLGPKGCDNFVAYFTKLTSKGTHTTCTYSVPKDCVKKADDFIKKLRGKRLA